MCYIAYLPRIRPERWQLPRQPPAQVMDGDDAGHSEGCNGRYLLDWDTAVFLVPDTDFSLTPPPLLLRSPGNWWRWRMIVSPSPRGTIMPSPQPRRHWCTLQAGWCETVAVIVRSGDWILMWTSEWLLRTRFLLWPGGNTVTDTHTCHDTHTRGG